jgi:hypothetical protein
VRPSRFTYEVSMLVARDVVASDQGYRISGLAMLLRLEPWKCLADEYFVWTDGIL